MQYTNRGTIYTISSVDAANNASTVGVNVIDERSVWFNTGDNYSEGYVARWTDIAPGSDGSFTVRATHRPDAESGYKAYSFDVFMLSEEGAAPPVMVGVCEDFESGFAGANVGDHGDWFDGGSGPVATAGNGVAGSVGLAPSGSIFTWIAHPFDWNAPDFVGVNVQMDFQTNGSGQFDDDRIGWMITDNDVNSNNNFGVQLDPGGGGQNIEAYWDGNTFGDDGGRTSIVDLPALTGKCLVSFEGRDHQVDGHIGQNPCDVDGVGCLG